MCIDQKVFNSDHFLHCFRCINSASNFPEKPQLCQSIFKEKIWISCIPNQTYILQEPLCTSKNGKDILKLNVCTSSFKFFCCKQISVKAKKILFRNSPTYCNMQIDLWKWSTSACTIGKDECRTVYTLYTITSLIKYHNRLISIHLYS